MSKGKIGVTAVKWFWRSDQAWVEFDADFCYKLETAHNGTNMAAKKVRVDKERFVDLTLNLAETKKQFQKVDCKDNELAGCQRRYDDETKRRAVKRALPAALFKGTSVFIALDDDDDEIFTALKTYSATVAKSVTKTTKMVLTTQAEASDSSSNFASEIAKASNLNIPVVKLECLIDAIKNEDDLDFNNKKYQVKVSSSKEEQEKKMAEENLKKRKVDEDEEDEPIEKKRKTIVKGTDTVAVVKTAAPKTNTNNNNSMVIDTPQTSTKAESSGLPVMIYVPSSWAGVCSYADEDFPFRVELSSLRGTKMTGTVEWPTLNQAKTKLRGTIDGNSFKFEEYEAISGAESVQIPSFYSGTIKNSGKTIEGKTVSGGDDENEEANEDDAKFKIDLVENDESSEEEQGLSSIIKEGAKFNGTSFVENTFSLKVTQRRGNAIQGTIYWDEAKKESKFKGQIAEEGKVTIEEFDNSFATPMTFDGQINNALLEGKCGTAQGKLNRKFTINLG